VAKALFEAAQHRTVLIEQDYYRFIFNPAGGGSKPNSDTIHKMIQHNVLTALNDGYDVILEGILSVRSYSTVLENIFKEHPNENYIFYFDIPFDETLRRHKQRKTPEHKFTDEDMREWYPSSYPSQHKFEQIIPASFTLADTVTFILETSNNKQ
jgi:hypothetical protein